VTTLSSGIVKFRCMATSPSILRFLDGRTRDGSVGLAPVLAIPLTGERWAVTEHADGSVSLRCLGDFSSPQFKFLDGRTLDRAVGLVPHTDPPFTGTHWRVRVHGKIVVLECLGKAPFGSDRFLDGRVLDGTVALAPTPMERFTGTRWLMQEVNGAVTLKCLGELAGDNRFLDGIVAGRKVGLAPHTNPPFTGTRWKLTNLCFPHADVEPGSLATLRCLAVDSELHFLDGVLQTRAVGLAPSTDEPFSGTTWRILSPSSFWEPCPLYHEPRIAHPTVDIVQTSRVGQLTGSVDPQGWLLPNGDTTWYGVPGVDLGATTEHREGGGAPRLFIFFGDVVRAGRSDGPPHDSDAVAWTTDPFVEENPGTGGGIHLHFVVGDRYFDPIFVPLEHAPAGSAAPGALAASSRHSGHLDVFWIGPDGGVGIKSWNGSWGDPWQLAPARSAAPGALAASSRMQDNLDVFWIGPDGGVGIKSWNGSWGDLGEIGFTGTIETPSGAFSFNDKVYVFVGVQQFRKFGGRDDGPLVQFPLPGCYLISKSRPHQPGPFKQLDRFSPPVGPLNAVAPVRVLNSQHSWLPPSEHPEGVVMFGLGGNRHVNYSAVSLSWMPLKSGIDPRPSDILYFTKEASGGFAWKADPTDVAPIFGKETNLIHLSAAYIKGLGRWIVVRQSSNPTNNSQGPIIARIGTPPLDWSEPFDLFAPCRDGAYGKYMHWPEVDGIPWMPPGPGYEGAAFPWQPGAAYGAFLLERYTRWNGATRQLDLYYLMSTGSPYQVQLMHTVLRIG
jgi:hypothetical protein